MEHRTLFMCTRYICQIPGHSCQRRQMSSLTTSSAFVVGMSRYYGTNLTNPHNTFAQNHVLVGLQVPYHERLPSDNWYLRCDGRHECAYQTYGPCESTQEEFGERWRHSVCRGDGWHEFVSYCFLFHFMYWVDVANHWVTQCSKSVRLKWGFFGKIIY